MITHKHKITVHEQINQVLLSGKVVSPDEIKAVFKGTKLERLMYRLSVYIYDIKLMGGVIQTHKKGRNVIGYQLVNAGEFNKDGRYIGPQPKPAVVTQEVTETPSEPVEA